MKKNTHNVKNLTILNQHSCLISLCRTHIKLIGIHHIHLYNIRLYTQMQNITAFLLKKFKKIFKIQKFYYKHSNIASS